MKKILLIAALCALLLLSACASTASEPAAPSVAPAEPEATPDPVVRIVLADGTATASGGGARVDGSVVTIASGGEYALSGTLDEGQIVIDTGDEAMNVYLTLEGVTLSNKTGPALWVRQAKNVHLILAAETKSLFVSGTEADLAAFDGTQTGAAVYAEDDLIIEGEGELEVRGYINNGIAGKDDLKLKSGSVQILAAGNGFRASESVEIKGGELGVVAGNDGVKASSAKKEGKGYVAISGGTVMVEAQGDGISAETVLTMTGGSVTVDAQGDGLGQSSNALKAKTGIEISDGRLTLSAIEDAISCDGSVLLSGGMVTISTKGDGVQAGEKGSGAGDITISGGRLGINAMRRGLNARGNLVIDGGTVLAYIGSEKQDAPAGSAASILAAFPGAAGERLQLNGEELVPESERAFSMVLYSGTLEHGASYKLSNGIKSVDVTAN